MTVPRFAHFDAVQLFGLARLAASLAAVCVIGWLVVGWNRDMALDHIEENGAALSLLLAAMPLQTLRAEAGPYTALERLTRSRGAAGLAYAAVDAPDGGRISESLVDTVGAPLPPPAAPVPATPDAWSGVRQFTLDTGRTLIEYHAPVIEHGEFVALVRLGYLRPEGWIDAARWRPLALLALPVLLLVPLFELFRRGELRGLRTVSAHMRGLAERHDLDLAPATARGDMASFLTGIQGLVENVDARFSDLRHRENLMRTTSTVLEYRQNRLLAILESVPMGVIVIDDSHAGVICNALAASILDVREIDIMGRPVGEWCPIPDLERSLDRAGRQRGVDRNGGEPQRLHWSPSESEGTSYEVIVRPLVSPSDRPAHGTLVAIHDVTEHELARRARGEFVGHLAHELKAPLQVLGMYAETLLSEVGEDRDFQVEAANVIDDEVRRLGDLIHNMLSLTQIEMGSLDLDRQRVRVGEFLADVFESATRSAAEQGIRCTSDIGADLSALALDKSLLRMALNNLLVNAIKYNRENGEVRLEAEETDDAILIRVSDTGIGISEADQARIFDRFWRVESEEVRERSGHGLGLTLARDIIQLHHGTLGVTSTLGEGTTFTVRLGKDISMLRQAV